MNAPPNAMPERPFSAVWLRIGAGVLLAALAIFFFLFASARLWRTSHDEAQPAGTVPGQPGPVIAH